MNDLKLTFQRLNIVAREDSGLSFAFSFPPVSLILVNYGDSVSSFKRELIFILRCVGVNSSVLVSYIKDDFLKNI